MIAIPLFPLSSVLFPCGRMALQIFEPRYLKLITQCLRDDQGFGIVWLKHGAEVADSEGDQSVHLSQIGSFAAIRDWQQLPNGLLGITVEGEKKFRLLSSIQQDDGLHIGEVEWLPEESHLPVPDTALELRELVHSLLMHPQIANLGIDGDDADARWLSNVLSQLLPVPEQVKFALLAIDDPLERLEQLRHLLEQLQSH